MTPKTMLCEDSHLPERFDGVDDDDRYLIDVLERFKTGDVLENEFELLVAYFQLPKQ